MLPEERLDTFSGDAISSMMANVASGQIPDAKLIYIYGHTPAVAGGNTSVLWELDGLITATNLFPTTPQTVYISSGSAADIGNTIKVTVLDSNYNEKEIGVTTNGQVGVVLPIQVRRVLLLENMGTTATAGRIYVGTEALPVVGVPALVNTMNMYTIGHQISHTATYTVPIGFTLLVAEFGGGTPTADSVLINAITSNPAYPVWKVRMQLPAYRGHETQKSYYFPLTEKTDIYLSVTAYTNNTEGVGHIFGALIPNHYLRT